MPAVRIAPLKPEDRILGAASGFTGLWALSWIGAQAVGASTVIQGGFAVGGVMASSGLTLLWWKIAALKELAAENDEAEDKEREKERASEVLAE